MATIKAASPQGQIYTFSNTGALHDAIKSYGYAPLHSDNSKFVVQPIFGGYVLDGAPINWWIEGVWYEGQKEALAPLWANGSIMQPPADVVATAPVPMPPAVLENWTNYQKNQNTIFGLPAGLVMGGAVVLGLMVLRK